MAINAPAELPDTTVGACLKSGARRLGEVDIPDARREARHLLGQVLGLSADAVFAYPERPVSAEQRQRFAQLIVRRSLYEPLSRIVGRREFWSLSFAISAATLDPRPDSETIIEAALEARPDRARAYSVLDLGTGSGCLIGALLSEYPNARGTAVDLSGEALQTAAANFRDLGLAERTSCIETVWDDGLEGRFDIIVSNPPYIVDGEIAALDPEVLIYDPRLALAGGADGLDAYRALAPVLTRRLAPDGIAIIEHGAGQDSEVADIFRAGGLTIQGGRADLAGRMRCIVITPT